MPSPRAKYELVAECKPEWSSSYIFIHKKYQFNVYLADKSKKKTKRVKKPRTNNSHLIDSNTNSVDSETFHIHVLCIDNASKPLDTTEHSISPSSSIYLTPNDCHSFTVTIDTLSMNHGDSQFRLSFHCRSPDIDCAIANQTFISVRVIHYKFKIYSTPHQLQTDDYKFYKDVKPKTNFLQYGICLLNANDQRAQPPRTVPIKCVIYFENGKISPNQKALNLKGINTIYNEPYKLNTEGAVTVPLRIEETSTKYENRKFQIKFIADYEKITSNLDIAPIFSEPFLVRTKINKYRIKNKEQKKKPGRKKKIKIKEIKDEIPETLHTKQQPSSHKKKQSSSPQAQTPSTGPIPLPQVMPLSLPSFIMPPLFATAPGMNMIQIDATENVKQTVPHPLTLPLLIDTVKGKKRGRKRNAEEAKMDSNHALGSNKRQKRSKKQIRIERKRRPTTRSMTKDNDPSPIASAESGDNVEKYGFNQDTSDKILEPMVIETLRMLGEAIGRREYFVSGSECICYLKCLFCGSTAYPPKEKKVKHVKGCLLSILYHNITQCVSPRVLLQAFDLNPPDFPTIDLNDLHTNNNNHNPINLLNMPTNNDLPPKLPDSIPPLPNISELHVPVIPEMEIAPYSRRNSSGSFSLVRSDRCKSFNGLIAPFNTLLDITPTPTQQNVAEEPVLSQQSLEDAVHVFGMRSRSNSYKLVPVSFPNTPNRDSNHRQNTLSQQSDAASFTSNLSGNHGYHPFPGTSDLLNSALYRSGSAGAHSLSGLLRGLPLNLFGSGLMDNDLLTNSKSADHDTTSKESSTQSIVKTQTIT
eukprot:357024_1